MEEYETQNYELPGVTAPLAHTLAISAFTGVLVFFLCEIIKKHVRFFP